MPRPAGIKPIAGTADRDFYGRKDLDLRVAGPALLDQVDGTAYFGPREAWIAPIVLTSHVAVATISIGTNAPNYDNLLGPTVLSKCDEEMAGQIERLGNANKVRILPPDTEIFVNVITPAIAASPSLWGVAVKGMHFS